MSVTNINIPTAQSFILVDTRTGPNKVLFLPAASTIQGRYLSIKDYFGGARNSSITISTTGLDRIDQRGIRYTLASSFGSVMLLSDGARSWNMLGLYEGADTANAMVAVAAVNNGYVSATGGTITTSGSYKIHTFTSVGSNTFTLTTLASITAEILIVGGGGAGGYDYGGGGGAGGAVYLSSTTMPSGSYTVTVGGGGGTPGSTNSGQSGSSSSLIISGITYTGAGGGGGGTYSSVSGANGGCGGGGGGKNDSTTGNPGTGSQGFAGGSSISGGGSHGAGGGGMGSVGSNATSSNSGAPGGAGLTYTLGGTSVTVAGGGGGGGYAGGGSSPGGSGIGGAGAMANTGTRGGDGTANTGSGGGGSSAFSGGGGAGGSGVVIIAYTTLSERFPLVQTSALIVKLDGASYSAGGSTWTNSVNSTNWTMSGTSYEAATQSVVFSSSYAYVSSVANFNSSAHTVIMYYYRTGNSPNPSGIATTGAVLYQIARSPSEVQSEIVVYEPTMWEYYSGFTLSFDANTSLSGTTGWVMRGFVKNGGTGTFYLNGLPDGTQTVGTASPTANRDFCIGRDYRDSNSFLQGKVALFAMWNVALSASEIATVHANCKGQFGL